MTPSKIGLVRSVLSAVDAVFVRVVEAVSFTSAAAALGFGVVGKPIRAVYERAIAAWMFASTPSCANSTVPEG
jgi:hypothetical protein